MRSLSSLIQSPLQSLDLQQNRIGDSGVQCIAAVLASTPTLTALDLSSNSITATGATELANAVTSKGLAQSRMSNSGRPDLRSNPHSLLQPLPHLSHVKLANNRLGDAGVSALAKALSTGAMPMLHTLHLNANNIRFTGAAALAEAFGLFSCACKVIQNKQSNKQTPQSYIYVCYESRWVQPRGPTPGR